MTKLLNILLLFLLIPSIGHGAPSITGVSGTLTHGQTVTITGSQFGTKATAAPVTWDTFEDGTANLSATIGTWETIQGFTINSTVGNRRHANSTYQGQAQFGVDSSTKGFSGGTDQYGPWFVSYHFRLDPNWVWGRAASEAFLGNVKFFRIWTSGDGSDDYVAAFHTFARTAESDEVITGTEYCPGGNSDFDYVWQNFTADVTNGSWHRIDLEYRESSASNSANGVAKIYFDGKLISSQTSLVTRCTGASTPKRVSLAGLYNSWGDGGPYYYWQDDTYIDNSWARVELCPGSTWATRGKCELQPPTSWGDTSISLTLNQGSFDANATAYLYVVDSTGAVSPSREITISSGGSASMGTVLLGR